MVHVRTIRTNSASTAIVAIVAIQKKWLDVNEIGALYWLLSAADKRGQAMFELGHFWEQLGDLIEAPAGHSGPRR